MAEGEAAMRETVAADATVAAAADGEEALLREGAHPLDDVGGRGHLLHLLLRVEPAARVVVAQGHDLGAGDGFVGDGGSPSRTARPETLVGSGIGTALTSAWV